MCLHAFHIDCNVVSLYLHYSFLHYEDFQSLNPLYISGQKIVLIDNNLMSCRKSITFSLLFGNKKFTLNLQYIRQKSRETQRGSMILSPKTRFNIGSISICYFFYESLVENKNLLNTAKKPRFWARDIFRKRDQHRECSRLVQPVQTWDDNFILGMFTYFPF